MTQMSLEDLFKQADMARSYITITDRLGPSQQLIDFINHDKGLSDEIGLEGFTTFSTQTQHELLLSKLNPDVLEQMACEGLSEKIDSFSKWILYGSGVAAISLIITGGAGISGVGPAANMTSGTLNRVVRLIRALEATTYVSVLVNLANSSINTIYPYSSMKFLKSGIDDFEKLKKMIITDIPTKFEYESWASFLEKLQNDKYVELEDSLDNTTYSSTRTKTFPDKSGWTTDNFVAEVKWFKGTVKQVNTTNKAVAAKIKVVEQWVKANTKNKDADVKNTLKVINKAMTELKYIMKLGDESIKQTAKTIEKASKMFKIPGMEKNTEE